MLAVLFVVGGIWFWVLTAVAIGFLLWEIEDRPFISLFAVIGYLALIHLFGDANIFGAIGDSPWILYLGIPIYLTGGAIWGVIKWALFVNSNALEYKHRREEFLRRYAPELEVNSKTRVPQKLRAMWKSRCDISSLKPNWYRNKWRIMSWSCYWPLSIVRTTLHEPWRYLYEMLSGMYQKIADSIYKGIGVEEDFDVPKDEEDL